MVYNIDKYIEILKDNNLISEISVIDDAVIENLTYNSKSVINNTLFVCKGAHFKEEYLIDAKKSGAVCYISEKKYDVDMDYIIVSDIRRTIALLFNAFYDNAWNRLSLIGITGTKGKFRQLILTIVWKSLNHTLQLLKQANF